MTCGIYAIFGGKWPESGLRSSETSLDILPQGVKNCVEHDFDVISKSVMLKLRLRTKKSIFFLKTWFFWYEGEVLESWLQLWKCLKKCPLFISEKYTSIAIRRKKSTSGLEGGVACWKRGGAKKYYVQNVQGVLYTYCANYELILKFPNSLVITGDAKFSHGMPLKWFPFEASKKRRKSSPITKNAVASSHSSGGLQPMVNSQHHSPNSR